MNVNFSIEGVPGLNAKLAKHPERLAAAALAQVKSQARLVAGSLAKGTAPVGFGETTRKKLVNIITAEITRAFPVNEIDSQNAGGIFKLLEKEFGKDLADAFWFQHKSGNRGAAARFVRRRGLPRGIDEREYDRRRRRKEGVGSEPIALATPGRVAALIRRREKRVGMAKAGWHQAAKAIGGRLRTETAGGKVVATFPRWVIAAGRGLSLGGARIRGGPLAEVSIYTSVRHSRGALAPSTLSRAVRDSQARLRKAALIAVQKENKKHFKR